MAGSAHTWADGDAPSTTYLNAIPYGIMGYVNGSAADQTGITAVTDITSVSVTFTAISTRLYRTTLCVNLLQNTSAGQVDAYIADGASTTVRRGSATLAANDFAVLTLVHVETGITGSTTRKGRASTTAGTVTVVGTVTRFCSIVVEDLGPA